MSKTNGVVVPERASPISFDVDKGHVFLVDDVAGERQCIFTGEPYDGLIVEVRFSSPEKDGGCRPVWPRGHTYAVTFYNVPNPVYPIGATQTRYYRFMFNGPKMRFDCIGVI